MFKSAVLKQTLNSEHWPDTTTENDSPSYSTTYSGRLDLFFKLLRKFDQNDGAKDLILRSWNENKLDTLRIVFQARDCRGGKGERDAFIYCLKELIALSKADVLCNLVHIPLYGRWDDLLKLLDTELRAEVVEIFCQQLKKDLENLQNGKGYEVSLAAKWAPTEGRKYDKKYCAIKLFCKRLGCDRKEYRKKYLTPLRKHLEIVERNMALNMWDEINYSNVPAICMSKRKKAFEKHDEMRFNEWKNRLRSGDTSVKVNTMQGNMQPHLIVKQYRDAPYGEDIVAEEQWNNVVDEVKKLGTLDSSLWLVDMSGSMIGEPMTVAMSLGILGSQLVCDRFKNLLITFSTEPQFFHIEGEKLYQKIKNIYDGMTPYEMWGGSTNLEKAYELILMTALGYVKNKGTNQWIQVNERIPNEEMPKSFYILSDMQFDCAASGRTNFDDMRLSFKKHGYEIPNIIFWNLRGDTKDFPVKANDNGVILLSGFSPMILKYVITLGREFTPTFLLKKILSDERYSRIRLSD